MTQLPQALGRAERANFAVAYDGAALREHRMNVRDLAPALLGMADIFQQGNDTLHPGEPPVSLEITATSEGSFLVELVVIHRRILDVLVSRESQGIGALMGYITGASGLFAYIKHKGRRDQEQPSPNGGVRLTAPDGTVLEISAEVLALYRQPSIRVAAETVLNPLSNAGINQFELRPARNQPPNVRIVAGELPGILDVINEEGRSLITDQRYEQLLTIVSPTFRPGNKWRLTDGQATYWMAVEDPRFLDDVASRRVVFGINDRLRVIVRLRQWESDAGEVHTERSILQVLDHMTSQRHTQPRLFDDD